MKKCSINYRKLFDGGAVEEAICEDPRPFRYIQVALAMVTEMGLTGVEPLESRRHLGTGHMLIAYNPNRIAQAFSLATRMVVEYVVGPPDDFCLEARIRFIGSGQAALFRVDVCADSDGIRFIREMKA